MRASPFLLLLAVFAGCGTAPQAQQGMPPPPQVGVASPIARDVPVVRELTGRVEAVNYVELRPQVSGLVVKVLVADGAEVKAGQVIMEIDQRPLANALAKAEAEVARSEAVMAQSVREVDRNRKLVDDKVVSQQVYDDAESARLAAQAAVAAAKAVRDSAKLDLDHAQVASPIDGRLGKVVVTAGNLVQGGGAAPATLLATIVSLDPVYVSFDLDEPTWNHVGARLRAATDGGTAVPVDVGVSGDVGFPHHGQVAFVDNQIDSRSGAIRIRAKLANPDRVLVPGAFARVRIEVEPPRPVLLIHEQAIQTQLTTKYVLTVDDKGATAFRPVQLGEPVGALRVVAGGLAPGDTIAVTNLAKIFFPGMPVAPTPVSMETLKGAEAPAPAPESKPAEAKPADDKAAHK